MQYQYSSSKAVQGDVLNIFEKDHFIPVVSAPCASYKNDQEL